MEDLNALKIPQLKRLIKERNIIMPTVGTGKNGAILKKDYIYTLTTNQNTRQPSNISDRYEFIRKLGEGGYGTVCLARSKVDGYLVAIKKMGIHYLKEATREFNVMKNIGCLDHVLCYRDLIVTKEHVYLVMDYLEGKDLYDVLADRNSEISGEKVEVFQPFSDHETLIIFEQLLTGLSALHRNNIVHMDIKPENIMTTRLGGLVIIDLGMTCSLVAAPKCDLRYSTGTKQTRSPEMSYAITQDPPKMTPLEFFASDVWMMGLVFKTVVELKYTDMETLEIDDVIRHKLTRDEYLRRWAIKNKLSPTATKSDAVNKLIDDMLNIDYRKRPTAEQLLVIVKNLSHRFTD